MAPHLGKRAFGGGPLEGERLVRMVYLDEAGIANPEHEPFVVLSGVIIDADTQWIPVERHLVSLADRLVPSEFREDFVFHAESIWQGSKKPFHRDNFDREARWKVLDELVAAPKKLELPVVLGFCERAEAFQEAKELTPDERVTVCLQVAFLECMIQVEKFMREIAAPDEVAMIFMEESKTALHKAYRSFHKYLQDPAKLKDVPNHDQHYLPLTKIVDTPYFAGKTDSSPLQISDACAFLIKRHLMRSAEAHRLYGPLIPNMCMRPRTDFLTPEEQLPLAGVWMPAARPS